MIKSSITVAVVALVAALAGGFGALWLNEKKAEVDIEPMQAAEQAFAKNDYDTVYALIQPLAEAGNNLAQQRLGLMFVNGWGVEADSEKAAYWFDRAVAAGNEAARQPLIELLLASAQHTSEQQQKADYYHRASELGSPEASAVLGSFYMAGVGVEKDSARALELLTAAAENNDARALTNLGYMYMNGVGVEADAGVAYQNYLAAARAGMPRAQTTLAEMYQHGVGVEKNIPEAVRWYLSAAEAGDDNATLKLSALITTGTIVPGDARGHTAVAFAAAQGDASAADWLQQQSDSGSQLADYLLGVVLLDNARPDADLQRGLKLLKRAANGGNSAAQTRLSSFYARGEFVSQDYVQSHVWANLAATSGNEEAVKARDNLVQLMTPEQITQAQRMARDWQKSTVYEQ